MKFRTVAVGAFVTATAAALQGIDLMQPEDRSAQTTLTLIDSVLRKMAEASNPPLRQADRAQIDKLRSELRAAVEGQPLFVGVGLRQGPSQAQH